jgi:predicted glycosyltransferase
VTERRVLFYVQHLLGIGHLRRAATLARAMQAAGLRVTLVSGGHPIPGLDLGGGELVQLPPTRAVDIYFKQLVDEHERPVDDAWKARRRELLLAAWRERQPHVLLLELFPFGRRQMRFELMPLLDAAVAAVPRPLVVSSVRDILAAQPKPERNDEMVAVAERYFDRVLVHGDPGFIAFDRTFPVARRIADRLHYTGYVVDAAEPASRGPGAPGWGEVIVSAGGGAVGERLLRTAMAARPLTGLADAPWRVLVGVKESDEVFRELGAAAAPGVVVERARADFPALLGNCRLSISQGGYNTLMEALHARARAVAVPYAGGLETEQTLRTRLLAERGLLQVVSEAELSPATLAAAIARALATTPADSAWLDTGGAARSAALVRDWAERLGW